MDLKIKCDHNYSNLTLAEREVIYESDSKLQLFTWFNFFIQQKN